MSDEQRLHSVVISYQRLELTRITLASYLETVTLPYTLVVVDNGSRPKVTEWLSGALPNLSQPGNPISLVLLGKNKYPGFACNRGWELAPREATLLHRADNDFSFRPGWCDEVVTRFEEDPKLGQLGLRTGKEELHAATNVGGNNIIRRELWDRGLRYDERPWREYPPGWSEDTLFSPAVVELGYSWGRVHRPCITSLASGDWDDAYYRKSYGDRRIQRPRDSKPGTQ